MANKFFRPLISSVLVICLMHFQTSIAFAQTVKGVTEEKGVVKTAVDGKKSQDVTYTFSEMNDSNMMATLTMIAIGFVSVSALKSYKNITLDMKVALAAGAAYLAGEIYSNISLKDKLDKMKIEFEKKSGESMQTQVEAFNDLKTAYTEAKKTIETKNMLQMAAAAAYATAAGIAGYTIFKESKTVAGLQASIKEKMLECGTLSAKVVTAVSGQSCMTQLQILSSQIGRLELMAKMPGPSASIEANFTSVATEMGGVLAPVLPPANGLVLTLQPQIQYYLAEKNANLTSSPTGNATSNFINNSIQKIPSFYVLNFLINKAHASWTSIIGFLGAGAVTFLALSKKELAATLDKQIASPKLRLGAWAVLTGLTTASLSANKKVIKDLEERIKKIDDILAALNNTENGAHMSDTNVANVDKSNLLKGIGSSTVLANGGTDNLKMSCVTSDASSNCPSIAKAITESPDFQELPITLQNLSKQAGNLGDSLQGQGKLSDAALSAADGLGAQNNAIQNSLKDTIEKVKKLDNSSDLDKDLKNTQNDLLATAKKAADKSGGAQGLYASLGGIPSNSPGSGLNEAKNIAKQSEFIPANAQASNAPGRAKAKNSDFDFKLMNDNKDVVGSDSPVKIDNDELAKEIAKESIGSSNGPSIFEILSHRYYMSGYPKLLEEE